MATNVEGFRVYVTARLPALRRVAFLMCGDWHRADDVLSTALVRIMQHWPRVSAAEDIDAYVRRVLMRTMLNERRRPWHRERSVSSLPEHASAAAPDVVVDHLVLADLLAGLPPRRRAVLVLRYCCDLSVEETAQALSCSPGTVKSQSAKGLATLRERMTAGENLEEESWTR
jgi:RNA polymerase sigma-70 factor (sigma-E family)